MRTTIESITARMLRNILVFILCSFSAAVFIPMQAQEAFYVYRNDGDFNGFFYDEVLSMGYSKIGIDSVEYDEYVVQEVVLADTTYRIPLAAIDSIGFQQPEIRLNPKVRFIERDGYSPYLDEVANINGDSPSNNIVVKFLYLPTDMILREGDVLIGLPTDEIAQEKYYNKYFQGGSFSCVVENIEQVGYATYVRGHEVVQVGEVFDQYITVEEIGIDKQGNIRRRIAGCTEDGWPRRITQKEGEGEATVIDFNSTVSHSWNIASDTTQVDLSADLNLKLRIRVAYNITWRNGVYVKITPDLLAKVKPSMGLSIKREFKATLSDIIPLPDGIPFPAACPIFELCPMPTLFMNASGKLEARLNMPQVGLGVGMDIIINSKAVPFPIYGLVHLAEDEQEEVTDEMLDLSAEVKLSGSIYTGVEFQLVVNTNRWFEKILKAGIGMHFTAGPKVTAELSYNSNVTAADNAYWLLSNGSINHTWLSLGFNAGAKGKVGWKDENEVTFLEANKDLFLSTIRLAPKFDKTTAEEAGDYVVLELHPQPGINLLYKDFKIGVYENWHIGEEPKLVMECGDWHNIVIKEDHDFSYTLPVDELQPLWYVACPVVYGPGGPFRVENSGILFSAPLKVHLDNDEMHFTAAGGEQSITFTTNCPGDKFGFGKGWESSYISHKIDTLDKKAGKYKLTLQVKPNNRLFSRCQYEKGDDGCPYLWFRNASGEVVRKYIKYSQDDSDLSKFYVYYFTASFNGENGTYKMQDVSYGETGGIFRDAVFTRVGKDTIDVSANSSNASLTMRIINTTTETEYSRDQISYVSSGTAVYTRKNGRTHETYTITFDNQPHPQGSYYYLILHGALTSANYDKIKYDTSGEIESEEHDFMPDGGGCNLDMNYSVNE